MSTNPETVARRYLALWNEANSARRRSLMVEAWSQDGTYADPMMSGQGREGVAAMIEAARSRFPDHGFNLRGQPDGHGRHLRFSCTLAADNGAPVARGTDVAVLDDNGCIAEVIGFLDGSDDDA